MGAVTTKVLVVGDEPQTCSVISHRLAARGFGGRATSDAQEAKALLAGRQFDVVIADIAMPVVSGLELLAYAKRHAPRCKVILITGKSNREALAQALMLGAYEYLERPFGTDELVAAVDWCDAHPDELILPAQPVESRGSGLGRAASSCVTKSAQPEEEPEMAHRPKG